jgi:hypothetical protein
MPSASVAPLVDPAVPPLNRSSLTPEPEPPVEVSDIIKVKDGPPEEDTPVEAIMAAMDIDSDHDSEKSGIETDDEVSDEDK